jgi:predicted NBD/HSP70 family sugar kinase
MLIANITGKPQLNRRVNRTLILDRIRLNGEISRAELAKVTQIRPPTVTAIIRDLLTEGLVVEVGRGETRGGRAPRILALSCRRPQAVGFEITETAILGGLSDLKGNLSSGRRVPYAPASPEQTLERLSALADEMFRDVRSQTGDQDFGWSRLRGIGIALPGLLDTAQGVVCWSSPLGWRDVRLRALCEDRWGVRTDIINDSTAGSMAAHFFEDRTVRNLVYIVLRFADATHGVVGVGTGLIVHGEPYHGEFGAAGEITTPVTHPLVHARNGNGQGFADTGEFVAALQAGNRSAAGAMDRVAEELALLLLHAINLLDPGRLIIESDVPALGEALRTRLGRVLDEHALRNDRGRAELVVSMLGEFGGVRGAVVPALRRFFKLPSWS